jgi:anti-sigma-K factor RskA
MSDAVNREAMLESVALYALGVLSPREAAQVAAFIASDEEAQREYQALRAAADAIGAIADEPVDSSRSARMRERLMARVRADAAADRAGSVTPLRRRPSYPGWMWGTGLVAAAAVVFSLITVAQDVALRGDLAAAQRRSAALQSQLAQDARTAAQDQRTLTDLLSSQAKRYEVADGSVIVHGDRLYFVLSKLPAPPRGHVYQAWTLAKGAKTMTPSVTFTPNGEGLAIVALPVDAAKVGTVAVSVEPEGGSKAPTTTPTFVRPLS